MDRLELQHLIWVEIMGGRYYLAPLHQINLTHALDVGTGTGSMCFFLPTPPAPSLFLLPPYMRSLQYMHRFTLYAMAKTYAKSHVTRRAPQTGR